MKITTQPDIQIIGYTAVNEIRRQADNGKQISKYTRSFRYESHDPLVSRRNAFNKLLDEKQSRMVGVNVDPEIQFQGLSLVMEYLVPIAGDSKGKELKKLQLLTGDPLMSTFEQLKRWEKELRLLKQAIPDQVLPVMSVEYVEDQTFDILDQVYWTQMKIF